LIAEFRKALADESVHFLSGYCFEYGISPYAPFEDALGGLETQRANPLRSRDRTTIAVSVQPGAIASIRIDDEDKVEAFGAIWRWLADVSQARPVVLVIEDAHWADNASLELIQHIARFVAKARVLL